MRIILFAKRNIKEILRDPINFFFGLGFPLILLVLLSIINNSIPPEAGNTTFSIENLAPGIAMFGTIFMSLFSGMLLSKDRTSSFLMRLFTSPMKSIDFILGYTLPMIIMTLFQSTITFLASGFFGFEINVTIIFAIAITTLNSFLYIGIGLLCGSLMNDKAVGGICGALLTNIAGWLSGIFIPLDLIGGIFKKTAEILPFYHCVKATQAVINSDYADILPHLTIVLSYTVVIFVFAIIFFNRKMQNVRK